MDLCCLIQIKWKKGKEAKQRTLLADFRQAFHTIHNRPALYTLRHFTYILLLCVFRMWKCVLTFLYDCAKSCSNMRCQRKSSPLFSCSSTIDLLYKRIFGLVRLHREDYFIQFRPVSDTSYRGYPHDTFCSLMQHRPNCCTQNNIIFALRVRQIIDPWNNFPRNIIDFMLSANLNKTA